MDHREVLNFEIRLLFTHFHFHIFSNLFLMTQKVFPPVLDPQDSPSSQTGAVGLRLILLEITGLPPDPRDRSRPRTLLRSHCRSLYLGLAHIFPPFFCCCFQIVFRELRSGILNISWGCLRPTKCAASPEKGSVIDGWCWPVCFFPPIRCKVEQYNGATEIQ